MKEAFDESLVKFIRKNLESELKEAKKDYQPDICDDLCEAINICDNLLTTDYFGESEKILDNSGIKDIQRWDSLYNSELKEKKKDLKRLFKILLDNMEEWC